MAFAALLFIGSMPSSSYAAFFLGVSGQSSWIETPSAWAMARRMRSDFFLPETIRETVPGFTLRARQISRCFTPFKTIIALTLAFISFLPRRSKMFYFVQLKYTIVKYMSRTKFKIVKLHG